MSKKWFGLLIVIAAVLAVSCGVGIEMCFAASACGSKCDINSACGGNVVGDGTGRPKGCTKSGTACVGECYRCMNSTATQFCRWTGNSSDTCWFQGGLTITCGTKTYYSCGGLWASNCTCPQTNPRATSEECKFTNCTV